MSMTLKDSTNKADLTALKSGALALSKKYGIDRESLEMAGISSETADSLYRQLYMSTVCLHKTVEKVIS